MPKTTSEQRGLIEGYRSGLEEKIAAQLAKAGIEITYEAHTLRYVKPEKQHSYKPDFILPNGIIVESKGRFITADRQKHLHIKACHPLLDIRFVFSNPNSRIGKQSKTTYAMWCERAGFQYAHRLIPEAWLVEPPNPTIIRATTEALGWRP